jgi:dolichol kinase
MKLFIHFKKAYDSVRREILHNILIDFGIPIETNKNILIFYFHVIVILTVLILIRYVNLAMPKIFENS